MINLLIGDALTRLRELPNAFVQCVVTSPPYFGLRNYGVDGQIGLEATPDDFVAALVEVFREVRRVLRHDGVAWLNLGDSYASVGGFGRQGSTSQRHGRANVKAQEKTSSTKPPPGIKAKNLLMIPARVAIALQADGWWLRSDIIWVKPNPMPESTADRPTSSHEHVFMLTKAERYYFDGFTVKEKAVHGKLFHGAYDKRPGAKRERNGRTNTENVTQSRNIRNVWNINSQPFKGAHFATFPQEIPRRCIAASTSECGGCAACGAPFKRILEKGEPDAEHQRRSGGDASGQYSGQSTKDHDVAGVQNASDVKRRILAGMVQKRTIAWEPTCRCPDPYPVPQTVLDPFSGAGTTAMVANRLGRDAIGIELNPEYVEMTRNRIVADDFRAQLVIS